MRGFEKLAQIGIKAIKATDQFLQHRVLLQEAGLQLLDALDRLESAERGFQRRFRSESADRDRKPAPDANRKVLLDHMSVIAAGEITRAARLLLRGEAKKTEVPDLLSWVARSMPRDFVGRPLRASVRKREAWAKKPKRNSG